MVKIKVKAELILTDEKVEALLCCNYCELQTRYSGDLVYHMQASHNIEYGKALMEAGVINE